jgi:outer membrane receptor for ferrienterochelin and colicin
MQTYSPNTNTAYSTSYIGNFTYNGNTFNNTNYGVDLREISTNNIEEIKVIQGIPSAKYGDLTSGLVLITSKVGKTPYRAYVSLRDATTEANITKGFELNKNNFINIGANYLDSKESASNNLLDYERISATLAWKFNNNNKTITNTLNTGYRFNLDKSKANPDDITDEIVKNKKAGFSLSNNFRWRILNKWIDALNIDLNFNYDRHFSKKSKWINQGIAAVTNSEDEGIREAVLLPAQYTYYQQVEGIPISTFINAEITKNLITKTKWTHNVSLGLSHRSSVNIGDGRVSSINYMSNFFTLSSGGNNTNLGYRDYSFRNTKTENQYTIYLEDRIFKLFKENQTLHFDFGLRYDNQLAYSIWQPRLNTSFSFNKTTRLRAGFGISSKTPSLNQLYTGNRYLDRLVGSNIYVYPGVYQIAWIQTIISPGDNLNLIPSKSYKSEIGLDLNLPFGIINFTGYYNKLKDGFSDQRTPVYKEVDKAEIVLNGTDLPTCIINGTEKIYYFTNSITNDLSSEDTGI